MNELSDEQGPIDEPDRFPCDYGTHLKSSRFGRYFFRPDYIVDFEKRINQALCINWIELIRIYKNL